uniref:Uncharacterized protein n=1 Tax=Cucumis melo TaxID=3656 RepID=A0A9I9E810_CUCME
MLNRFIVELENLQGRHSNFKILKEKKFWERNQSNCNCRMYSIVVGSFILEGCTDVFSLTVRVF